MMLFEKARENEAAVKQVGLRAIAAAHMAGVPAFYLDPALGEGIIKEMPDGTRHRLKVGDASTVVETYGPRS